MGASAPPVGKAPDRAAPESVADLAGVEIETVLVVDDNERHLDIISALLSAAGFSVEANASALDALYRLATAEYSVLVLDMVMPGLNGQGVLDRLGGLPRNAGIPVVICTANVSIAQIQLAQRADIHAIVGKPINSRELVGAVGAAMSWARCGRTTLTLDHDQVRS